GEGFFFQAEDGIRDKLVTGVQTCALPISGRDTAEGSGARPVRRPKTGEARRRDGVSCEAARARADRGVLRVRRRERPALANEAEIGRASCRERVATAGGGVARRHTTRKAT